ncbi:MAG: enoyl-CoA hydratase/isomerase family protein, partial [Desulfobacteraceae bacterium]
MEYNTLLYEKSEGIATITLNRPEVLNALNQRLWLELQNALEDAQQDQTIKVVILTGQGRAFSS